MKKTILIGALACLSCLHGTAQAAWPNDKPIELVVGFAPGGGTDIMARTLARFVEKRLGESARIIVVNKPGSGGEIAAAQLQNAKPDGYTLGMINVPGFIFLPMYRKTLYQPDQVRLLARVVDDPAMLVTNREGEKPVTLAAFVEEAKKAPGTLSVGHSGEGTTGHLGMLELARQTNIKFNSVPFKGMGEAKVSLLGGHVDYVMMTTGEAIELAQPGSKLAGVALWSDRRATNGVPTAAEQGLNMRMSSERGIGAPRALPDDIAHRLEDAIAQTLDDPEFLTAAKADAPVLAFLRGDAWSKHLERLRIRLQTLVPLIASGK